MFWSTSSPPSNLSILGFAILLAVIALMVRLPNLDTFWTADETHWVKRSHEFLLGLVDKNHVCPAVYQGRDIETVGFGCTFQTFHPGVTTMWAGTAGILYHYLSFTQATSISDVQDLQGLSVDPTEHSLIWPVRLPTVIISTIFIALFFYLTAHLFNIRVAFVAGLLLALDPFHSALSRILHHDALTTTFMTLSVLMVWGYWWQTKSKIWLIGAGMMAGLAFLSKNLALYLIPFTGLSGLLWLLWQPSKTKATIWLRLLSDGIIWSVAAMVIYVAFFPALWTIPSQVLSRLFLETQHIVGEGHRHFFLGMQTNDPGWLFYPLTIFLRLSPMILIGLIALVVRLVILVFSQSRTIKLNQSTTNLFLYIILFVVLLSLADKKLTRYALPIYPMMAILAASGLVWLTLGLADNFIKSKQTLTLSVICTVLVIIFVQGSVITSHHPYYFTYYSPFFGGTVGASKLVTIVGEGEGQDLAAAYLNQKPNASQLSVATENRRTFSPFFVGETKDFTSHPGGVLTKDYTLVYINQTQRNLINEATWHYFQNHLQPEQFINLHGVNYVTIYPMPVQNSTNWKRTLIENEVALLGYNFEATQIRLFWQSLGSTLDKEWWLNLQKDKNVADHWLVCNLDPAFTNERNKLNAILESVCPIPTLDSSDNLYYPHLAWGQETNRQTIDFSDDYLAWVTDANGQLKLADEETVLVDLVKQQQPQQAKPLAVNFGTMIRLTGYYVEPTNKKAEQNKTLWLYWQPLQKADLGLAEAFELVIYARSPDSQRPVLVGSRPMFANLDINQELKRGVVIPVEYNIPTPNNLAPGSYSLDICLTIAASGQSIPATYTNSTESVDCVALPSAIDYAQGSN